MNPHPIVDHRRDTIAPAQPTRVGETLRALREARWLSQSKLAERAGFDHSYVSRIESGGREPSRDALVKLAAAMDLEPHEHDELLIAGGFAPDDPASLLAAEPELSDVLALLQDATVPDEYRESVRIMLGMIAGQARMVAAQRAAVVEGEAA